MCTRETQPPQVLFITDMTRGNQRELAREKNAKRQQAQNKGTSLSPGISLAQKQENDAKIMREKLQKAKEQKENAESAAQKK